MSYSMFGAEFEKLASANISSYPCVCSLVMGQEYGLVSLRQSFVIEIAEMRGEINIGRAFFPIFCCHHRAAPLGV